MNQREASREEWECAKKEDIPTYQSINSGSLQRIADACELMAESWQTLKDERDQYEILWEKERQRKELAWRRIRSFKGVITRLKNANRD